jgi:hypothetical protein
MRYAASWIPSALFVLGVTTSSFAASDEGAAAAQDTAVTTAKVPISIFGKKLTGVDGSTIEIATAKDSFWREMATADGALQKLNFAYLNDTLGTVTNARDASRVTAVFRATTQEIFIHYTDGSTERLTPNSGGGLSIETRSPGGTVSCKSFYDEGHVFGIDERKAALAQFARHLGIVDSPDKSGAQSACPAIAELSLLPVPPMTTTLKAAETAALGIMDVTVARPGMVPAVSPSLSVPSPFDKDPMAAAAAQPLSTIPAVVPVSPPVGIFEETKQSANTAIAERIPTPGGQKEGAPPSAQLVNVLPSQVQPIDKMAADGEATAPQPTNMEPSGEQAGASSCLVVESNGRHWGFRNRCRYDVQFAYCTMDEGNPLTSCREGSVGGSVAPNGFGVLVADENLRAINMHHDFRWVACRGGAGEVIARLDRTDPPTGRCVR